MLVLFSINPRTMPQRRKPFDIGLSRLVPLSPWYTDGTRRFGVRSWAARYKRENEAVMSDQEPGQTDWARSETRDVGGMRAATVAKAKYDDVLPLR
jgi:hypothetical protein